MAPSAAELAILLRLRGSRQVQSEFKSTARAMKSVNPVVRQMGQHFGFTNKAIVGIDGRIKSFKRNVIGMGKTVLATAGIFAAWNGLKTMVNTTEDFAKQTIRMTKATRLDAEESSRWVAIMRIRGIDATSFSRGLTIMSTKLRDATNGGKSSRQTFSQLGLNWRSLMALPLEERLFQVTDALNSQTDAGNRLALGQRVFGRGFQKLLPILSKGSDQIREQLKLADKYGVTLHGKTVKSMKEYIEAQHEQELAMLGMQITLSQSLIPAITNVTIWLNKFVLQMRDGKGRGGEFADALRDIWSILNPLIKFMANHLGTTAKFVALIYAMTKAYKGATAAAIAFDAASIANPIGAAAAALVAIIALLYLFDRRTHIIRDHWKQLIVLLPLIGVPALIVANAWKPVLNIFKGIVNAIKSAVNWAKQLKSGFGLAGKIGNALHVPHVGILGHANGGMTGGGPIRVGEFGPEIINVPRGSHVTPASRTGNQPIVVHVHSHLDGKVVAHSVATVTADAKARR